jgi:hypothetical protein
MKATGKSLIGAGALAAVLLGGIQSGSAAGWTYSSFTFWMTCANCGGGQKSHTFSNPTETVSAQTLWGKVPLSSPNYNAVGYMQPGSSYWGATSIATQAELDCTNGTVTRNSIYVRDDEGEETWSNDNGIGKCDSGGYLERTRLRVGRYQE